MDIHAVAGIMDSMDISALSTTNDIDQLRTLAFTMVQSLMARDALIQEKEHRIRLLEEALMLARQQRFGRKGEALSGLQRSLFEEDTDADIAAAQTQLDALLPKDRSDEAEKRSTPVRKPLAEHLPHVEKVMAPTSDHCPDCGHTLRFMRDEISERLDYIPARFVVNRYIRPQYSCDGCQTVVSASLPATLIPKGLPEVGLVTQVVVSKYRDYQPLYRQHPIFTRSGVDIPVSTLAGWVGTAGVALEPLVALMRLELLKRTVLHADETPLLILDAKQGGKARKGYLWAYVSGEKTGPAIVCFDSQPGRAAKYPQAYLSGWRGNLVSDGYAAYHPLNNGGEVVNVACWAHVRRGFADLFKANQDPRAETALKMIGQLYKLEKSIRHRPVDKIRQWRQRYSKPRLEALWVWLACQVKACAPGSALYKAIQYALNHKIALCRFVDDGELPLDNNRCERAIRPVVMGRSNGLFAGSLAAGQRAANIMSLLETARLNGLEPYAWLKSVLTRLPEWPEERLYELLPFAENTFTD
ncbi:IS66 family transposase [Yersinia enterocolitica]|nr:IS66 family transposase [Yersinia enterocolitica]PNM27278.1 IS66 family transposase [Yersinia enterocolitica]